MLDYVQDLEADFRVFYRIDDLSTLDGPTFLSLAFRTPHYSGAMRAALDAIVRGEDGYQPTTSSGSPEASSSDDLSGLISEGLLEVL
jgi:hypothetical protein